MNHNQKMLVQLAEEIKAEGGVQDPVVGALMLVRDQSESYQKLLETVNQLYQKASVSKVSEKDILKSLKPFIKEGS